MSVSLHESPDCPCEPTAIDVLIPFRFYLHVPCCGEHEKSARESLAKTWDPIVSHLKLGRPHEQPAEEQE